MKRKLFASLLALALLVSTMAVGFTALAEDAAPVTVAPTDATTNWNTGHPGTFSVADGAIKLAMTKPEGPWYGDNGEWVLEYLMPEGGGVNAEGMTRLQFELYVSDPVVINEGGADPGTGEINLYSGARGDTERLVWHIGPSGKHDFVAGWNTVTLNVADGTKGADFTLANIQSFKIHEMAFFDAYKSKYTDYDNAPGYDIQVKNIRLSTEPAPPPPAKLTAVPTDALDGWNTGHPGTFSIDDGSLKLVMTKPEGPWYGDNGEWVLEYQNAACLDFSGKEGLYLDIYLSDPTVVNKGKEGHVTLRSGAHGETEAMDWKLGSGGKADFKQGWNTVFLSFASATTGADFDPAGVNLFKVHVMNFVDDYTGEEYTIQVKNIHAGAAPKDETDETGKTEKPDDNALSFVGTAALTNWNTGHPGTFSIEDGAIKLAMTRPEGPWYADNGEWVLEYLLPQAVSLEGYAYIGFDIYVSDPTVINQGNQGEVLLMSGDRTEVLEWATWNIGAKGKNDFKKGWNTVYFKLSDAKNGATFKLSSVTGFKIHEMDFADSYQGSDGYTIKLRNIKALKEIPGEGGQKPVTGVEFPLAVLAAAAVSTVVLCASRKKRQSN